jgi:predicted DNA binding CopG/RHH family protein
MAEEKRTAGANKIQLTISDKLKENVEKKAQEIGVPLTQYIVSLMVQDIKDYHKTI